MPYYQRQQLDAIQVHFIIGSNRSGTTLLTTILNAHPAVVSTPEARLTLTFYSTYAHRQPIPAQFATDLADYTRLSILRRVSEQEGTQQLIGKLDEDVFLHFDSDRLVDLDYAALNKLLLLNMIVPNKDYTSVNTIVDKNPSYTFQVAALLRLFPHAKFVVAMRDYRAIVLSHKESAATALVMKKEQSKKSLKDIIVNSYKWDMYNKEILRLQKKYPNNILIVSYENIVQQTTATIQQACDFLHITYDAKLVSPHQRLTPQVTTATTDQRDQKRITDLVRPINDSRLKAWETKLHPNEIYLAEMLCANTGKQLGYQPTIPISWWQKIRFYLQYAPILLWLNVVRTSVSRYHYYLPISWRLAGLKWWQGQPKNDL